MLRPYQQQAIAAVKQHWLAGRRAVVLVMPVGGGKTRVAEHLMVNVLDKSWAQIFFIAHTEQLIDQPAQRFQDRRIAHAFVKAGREADATAQVQFCSDATMVRRDVDVAVGADGKPHTRAVVIVDEAHRVRSATYLQILTKLSQKFQFVYLLLLTGTPYRLDGRGLADVASALVEAATPRQLMGLASFADGSTLKRPVILPPRYISKPVGDGDAEALLSQPQIVGDVVGTWLREAGPGAMDCGASGLATICRAYTIAHSKLVADRFTAAGVKAAHIDGTLPTSIRRQLLVDLAIGRLQVLCSGSTIFDEGYDSRASYEMLLPRGDGADAWAMLRSLGDELGAAEALELRRRVVDSILPELRRYWPAVESALPMEPPTYVPLSCLIDAAPTASCGAWMQRQGRAVRSWYGDGDDEVATRSALGLTWSQEKRQALVICHSGNLERHGALVWHEGFSLTQDATWAAKPRPATQVPTLHPPRPVTCPRCLSVEVAGAAVCAHCGESLVTARLPDEDRDVVLVEKKAESVVVSTPSMREDFLRGQIRTAKAKGYKLGWALARYKARFGFWPDGGMVAMMRRQMGM